MMNEIENFARGMAELRGYLYQWKKEHEEGRGSDVNDAPNNTLKFSRSVANSLLVKVIDGLIRGGDPRHQAEKMLLALEDPRDITSVAPNGHEEVRAQRKQLDRYRETLEIELAAVKRGYRTLQANCKHPALFYTGYNAEKHSTHYCPDCAEYSYHIGPPLKDE